VNSALPASLVDYRDALEAAARRDLARHRHRRLAVRWAVAAAVVAAAALGALSLVSRHGAGASVVDRAAAAVALSPGTILHVDMLGSQTNGDGSVVTWRDESWQQQGAPDGRQIETGSDGSIVESATAGRRSELYDRARNTIYVSAPESTATPEELNSYSIEPGPRPGTAVLQFPGRAAQAKGARFKTAVITTAQAKSLRNGTGLIAWRFSKRNGVISSSLSVIPASSVPKPPPSSSDEDLQNVDSGSSDFRGQILALLRSGEARVVGHRTIDGQDTIEIASASGHTTYFVDPGSYRPVELRTRGTDGGTALRFRTYETLSLGDNRDLLSLTAQHPDARVDRDPADYEAADARLHPHG